MANFKCNLFFTYGTYGWSETYYNVASDYNAVLVRLNIMGGLRQACLVSGAGLEYARITDEDAARDSFLYRPAGSRSGGLNSKADQPFTACKIKMRFQNLYWRQLYLRGIPDDVSQPDVGDNPALVPAFDAALTQFMQELRQATSQWCLKVINKGNPRINILSVDPVPQTVRTRFVTVGAHGLAVGDLVKVYNLRNAFPNSTPVKQVGTKQVKSVTDPLTFDVDYTLPATWLYASTAKMRKITPDYKQIQTTDFDGITHRIVGRPFDQSRGRRSGRR